MLYIQTALLPTSPVSEGKDKTCVLLTIHQRLREATRKLLMWSWSRQCNTTIKIRVGVLWQVCHQNKSPPQYRQHSQNLKMKFLSQTCSLPPCPPMHSCSVTTTPNIWLGLIIVCRNTEPFRKTCWHLNLAPEQTFSYDIFGIDSFHEYSF